MWRASRGPVSNWYTATLNSGLSFVNVLGTTQFRLRFTLGDNDDLGADLLKFFSANHLTPGYRPYLVVDYYIP